MRQGCLVCGQWVPTGVGHLVVMKGTVGESKEGRIIRVDEVEGLICSEHISREGSIIRESALQTKLQEKIAELTLNGVIIRQDSLPLQIAL